MATIRRSASLTANAANSDQLTTDGIPLETRVASQDGVLTLAATESQADVLLSLIIDGQRVTIDAAPVVKATGPVFPDDVVCQVPILRGQVVSLAARNTAGSTSTLLYYLDIP